GGRVLLLGEPLRWIADLRRDPDQLDWIGQVLERDRAPIRIDDTVEGPGQVTELAAHENLPSPGESTKPRGQVERPAPIPLVHRHRLARSDPDSDRQRLARMV